MSSKINCCKASSLTVSTFSSMTSNVFFSSSFMVSKKANKNFRMPIRNYLLSVSRVCLWFVTSSNLIIWIGYHWRSSFPMITLIHIIRLPYTLLCLTLTWIAWSFYSLHTTYTKKLQWIAFPLELFLPILSA